MLCGVAFILFWVENFSVFKPGTKVRDREAGEGIVPKGTFAKVSQRVPGPVRAVKVSRA